jgi:glycosyltransferase involved in cell wall biosynthesis
MASNGGSMKKKILLKAPVLTRSGYGEQSRFALRSLRSREDLFEIFIQPLRWGKTSWINEYDEERIWIDKNIEKTIAFIQSGGQFDMSLQVTIPNEFEQLAPINIGYTAGIETTKVSHQWIQKANIMTKILTISSHSKKVFENSEYQATNTHTGQEVLLQTQVPVEYINYPVKKYDNLPNLKLDLDTSFNFLCIAQLGPRKNLQNTIKWFVEEFRNEDVGLVLKTNIAKNCVMDRSRVLKDLKSFINTLGEKKCKVYLLHGDMSDKELHSLYHNEKLNAFISLPHGEGFGLPIFEAAYSGMPVVSTGWSGQLDFLIDGEGKEQFYNVAYDLQPVQKEVHWEGVIIPDSMWAYPREGSAKSQMRRCYEDLTNNINRWDNSKITERFEETKMYKHFIDLICDEETVELDNWLSQFENMNASDEDSEIVEYD